MIFLKTNLKKGSDVMSKKNENINEEVKNAEETAEDIKDTETKEEASKETEETKEAAADDKIAELEASVADWKDKYQRLMAEFENARKLICRIQANGWHIPRNINPSQYREGE